MGLYIWLVGGFWSEGVLFLFLWFCFWVGGRWEVRCFVSRGCIFFGC